MKYLPPRRCLALITALLLAPLAALHAADTPKQKPNIVFLFADDMGWGDLRCYGHPYAQTPNLDKLAADGTRFLQCYATGVTCCPSRTGFMTSQFPARFAKYPADAGFGDRVTITDLLKKQGYVTGHFGKWHIGPNPSAGTYGIDAIGTDGESPGGGRKASVNERGRDAHIYDETVRFIEKHRDEPFYVNVWDHIPHAPVNPSQTLLDAFGPLQVDESKFPPQMREKFARCKSAGGDASEHMRAYLAEIRSMDAAIGHLLQRLDELGLRERTIVVFSSDQGPADIRTPGTGPGEKAMARKEQKRKDQGKPPLTPVDESNPATNIRLNAMGSSGPFRGGKHYDLEGGIRIPLIVRWPGHVPAGRVDEKSVLSGVDWLPTLCTLTGTEINVADFDGEDTSAAWLGNGEHTRTKPLFWKLPGPGDPGTIRDGSWKFSLARKSRGEPELYDITADPGEAHNVAKEHPDIVKRLSFKLEAWKATLPKSYDKSDASDSDN